MTALTSHLAEVMECSERAAQEITKHGQDVAKRLRELRKHYDIDLVLDTKRKLKRQETTGDSRQAKVVSAFTNNLSLAAKRFWAAYLKAGEAIDQFHTASRAFDHLIHNEKSTLTIVLEALHSYQLLTDPEAVAEGRIVYEALGRDFDLRFRLGISPTR